ncbi:MAG: MFS transporter [Chloroflexi bacterium]|nr:MFS transporter [Chloroflexota bacterium]
MAIQFSVQDGKPWKPRFFTIWGGQALSILGSQLVQFALIWYLTLQTGSATVLATASLVGTLPQVILGPFVGTLVDRWNRRRIILLADSIITLATILLAVLFALDGVTIWLIYVGTALFAILPLLLIQIPQPARIERGQVQGEEQATIWQDFQAGFRYLLGSPGLLIVGLMTVGINFTIIPAYSLLPLMVKSYFGGSAIHLGWVESAMGIGIIVGGALLGVWGGFKRRILTSMIGLMGMGAGTLILALAPSSAMYLAVGGALLVGVMNPITMGPFFAVIQSTIEPDMQARSPF